ncbi:MAG: hypothetical protein ABSC02_02600 [Acidobacteriota bacterium]|jgi:hypothetical protein
MTLTIGDAPNLAAQQGSANSSVTAGDRFQKRPAIQTQETGDGTPRPKSLPDEPENRPMRTQPTSSTEDSLRRLHESEDLDRQRNRPRKGATAEPNGITNDPSTQSPGAARCPYDPPPTRQRDLDLLA